MNIIKVLIGCFLLGALISCSDAGLGEPTFEVSEEMAFSGKELYSGLFQFRGDFAEQTEMTANAKEMIYLKMSEKDLVEVNRAYDHIIDGIDKFDPVFFETFQSELYSNDFNRIEKALGAAAEISIASLLTGKSVTTLTDSEKGLIQELADDYNLSNSNELKLFILEANRQTSLDIDLASIEGFDDNISDPVALSTFYAAVVAVLVAAALSLAVAVHAVVAYAGVVAAQAVYVYNTVKLWGIAEDNEDRLEREFFVEELVSGLYP